MFSKLEKQLSLSLFGWKDEDIENIHIRGKVSAEKTEIQRKQIITRNKVFLYPFKKICLPEKQTSSALMTTIRSPREKQTKNNQFIQRNLKLKMKSLLRWAVRCSRPE